MSHELRTPLNAVIGYTEIQLAGMAGEMNEEQREYQERVLANADHLLSLINDVLDLSKIEAGRMDLALKPFPVRDWLEEIMQENRVLAEQKGLVFRAEVDRRLPETVVGDRSRIKQMLVNLVGNAIKFTEKGSILVILRPADKANWQLIVKDSGVGIPSHMQETIFEEFRQVDGSARRQHGGSGLGLAIVRKFAVMMGGSVRVSSEANQGSTFTITLPIAVEVTDAVALEQ
jgi:signal transduction histidine kinase